MGHLTKLTALALDSNSLTGSIKEIVAAIYRGANKSIDSTVNKVVEDDPSGLHDLHHLENNSDLIGICNTIDISHYAMIPKSIRVMSEDDKLKNFATDKKDPLLLIQKIKVHHRTLEELRYKGTKEQKTMDLYKALNAYNDEVVIRILVFCSFVPSYLSSSRVLWCTLIFCTSGSGSFLSVAKFLCLSSSLMTLIALGIMA